MNSATNEGRIHVLVSISDPHYDFMSFCAMFSRFMGYAHWYRYFERQVTELTKYQLLTNWMSHMHSFLSILAGH